MKVAKIISFIAFISNSCLSISSFISFQQIQQPFEYLDKQTPFPWPLLTSLIFTIASIIYWFYLRKKGRKGENVKFALLGSIVLLIVPIVVIIPITFISFIRPIYEEIKGF